LEKGEEGEASPLGGGKIPHKVQQLHSVEVPGLYHDLGGALQGHTRDLGVGAANKLHRQVLAVEGADDEAAVRVEARELAQVVESDADDGLCVRNARLGKELER
jgi:hypothetical protein